MGRGRLITEGREEMTVEEGGEEVTVEERAEEMIVEEGGEVSSRGSSTE